MTFMEELNNVFPLHTLNTNIMCAVNEENQSCIRMTSAQNFTPQTKHIAVKYHHLCSFVKCVQIVIKYIRSQEQKSDTLTDH